MKHLTIAEFLLARITEDEELARKAAQAKPRDYDSKAPGAAWEATDNGMVAGNKEALWDCEGSASLCMNPVHAQHVAAWDPARVLAECAGKRAVISACLEIPYGADENADYLRDMAMAAFATVYKSHPDYLPEWAWT